MSGEKRKLMDRLVPKGKVWLELDRELILGRGGALLLRGIDEHGSISQALKAIPEDVSSELEVPSYRFAWGYLRKVEKRLGASIVEKRRGHREGPGGTALTKLGQELLKLYEAYEQKLQEILSK